MDKKILILFLLSSFTFLAMAQIPEPVRHLLKASYMKGASFALIVKDLDNGNTVYSYDPEREMTPASVMKTVTTAAALELLGAEYRYPTTLQYDGTIVDGILQGNLYIKGSGDPSLGSSHLKPAQEAFLETWIEAVKKAGIREITGTILADESIFDTEGVSPKYVNEDLGSYYGAGSYGLSVFDNLYKLSLKTGSPGSKPILKESYPDVSHIHFHNYLKAAPIASDSSFIIGPPFLSERYLYGLVPANRENYTLKGDIPDPALFLAEYFAQKLEKTGIRIKGAPSCHRLLSEKGTWPTHKRKTLITTYSPPLKEIVSITNHVSHNLYADALIKTLGLQYPGRKGEALSSFGRGIEVVRNHWKEKGLDISSLWMYDGCGLAPTDKLSAGFMGDFLYYMATRSESSDAFIASLPYAGQEGSVRRFLKGSKLQGKARLKSGGMSRVKSYAGYITQGNKPYAVAVFVTNYTCDGREITKAIEKLFVSLFP